MKNRCFLIAALCLTLLVLVSSNQGSSSPIEPIKQVECLVGNATVVSSATQAGIRSSGPEDQALKSLFTGEMQFSLDLFKTIFKSGETKDENLFLSPMSIYSALLLAYFGSHNRTEDQLVHTLGLQNLDKIGAAQAYKLVKFTRQLMRVSGLAKYDFDVANRFYFDNQMNIRPCMKEIFNEDIEMMDFNFQPDQARQNINQWIEKITKDKIKNFATPETINSNTRMALVNAAYFKGQWASQFKTSNTRLNSFVIDNKKESLTNMMFQKGDYRHVISEELQASLLEMPFLGNDVSFFVLLPESSDGLEDTLNRLTLDALRDAMSRTFPLSLEVGLPKFQMEQSHSLRETLTKMGVTDLFDVSSADLSAFTGIRGLSVDEATHKAFIEVNEEGSEAAAVTALVSARSGRLVSRKKFICDHPFLFFIYDKLSQTILFMGVYRNPK